MGKLSFLKDVAEILLMLVGIAVFLFLPSIITYTLYWNRLNDNIEYTNMMVQFLWFMIVMLMYKADKDDE